MKWLKKIIIGCGIFLTVLAVAGLYKVLLLDRMRGKTQVARIGAASFNVEIADNAITQAKGLSGRESLPEKNGMLFLFSRLAKRGFWMPDMHFSLDMVWIKGDKVVGISENIPPAGFGEPDIYYPPEEVDKVLEINAGSAKKYALKIGDVLVLE